MSGMREPGPRSREIVERERRHAAAGMQGFALYAGLAMARGQGCTLVDEDGQEYIDFIAGIAVGSVGHCHPHYVEALKRQVEKLHFGSFTTEARARFLELVASVMPEGLTRIQMFSGGADGGPAWFRWFYHKDQRVAGHPFEAGRLARLVRAAATALGLEVYGGDAIASADGGLVLLDVNAWPSFALFREEAASVIAAYLSVRFREGPR